MEDEGEWGRSKETTMEVGEGEIKTIAKSRTAGFYVEMRMFAK